MNALAENIKENYLLLLITEINPRIEYVINFVFESVLMCPYKLTNNREEYLSANRPKLNYTAHPIDNDIQIVPHNIIFQEQIVTQEIEIINWRSHKAFFKTSDGQIPFDIFGATFYLISRYEEYLTDEKDEFGRFPHNISLAFKNDFLNLPLVDFWLHELKKIINGVYPNLSFGKKQFHFTPTYDIDIAYSYKHKGLLRNVMGAAADVVRGTSFLKRIKVLIGIERDPYDAYDFLDKLHDEYNLKPIYFFLLSDGGQYDKNIPAANSKFRQLIQGIADKYQVGIHPSYRSHSSPEVVNQEIDSLKSITNLDVTHSRQHYIKFLLPDTYKTLLDNEIKDDYSMGYGSINGFRASTSNSFLWFDLGQNSATSLVIHPFCFMECNSFFEQKQSIIETQKEIDHYIKTIKEVDGNFISIWHNFSLGTDKLWQGWKDLYVYMIQKSV